MRLLYALFLLLSMQSCAQQKAVIITKDIKLIAVEIVPSEQSSDTVRSEITAHSSIVQLVEGLNENEREPIKFYPTHRLRVLYSNGEEKMIYCSGTSMKYDGLTYKLKRSIRELLGQ